jgi:rubrerythrin
MNEMTASNLRSAFGGESQAHMRYKIWGNRAKEEGFKNVSRLFEAIAYAEQIHATKHFKTMKDVSGAFLVPSMAGFGLGKTSSNLQGAIEGETYEKDQMYPAFHTVAEFQKEKEAVQSFTWAWETEKAHAKLFTKAKRAVDKGTDLQIGPVYICELCGYTMETDPPEKCPVCGIPKKDFREFE